MAKRFSLLAAAGVLALWMIPQSAGSQDEVVIGIPLAITGMHAKFGEQHHYGYRMAFEEILAQGGIRKGVLKGKNLRFVFKNDEGNSQSARVVTEKLITWDKVPIIMGGCGSAEAFAIAVTTAQYGTPFLSPGGAADEITQKGWKNIFRLNPPVSEHCSGLQDFMLKFAKPTSAVILYENSQVGSSTAKAVREWCKENNIKVPMFGPYRLGNVHFELIMTPVKALKPDVIFLVSYIADAILLARQADGLGIESKLLYVAAAGFDPPEYLAALGKLGEGVIAALPWSHDVKYPGAQQFYGNFVNRFKWAPTYYAAEAYSAAYVMQDVLERTKSLSKEDLIKALSETDMMTIFGPVKFVNCKKFTNQNRVPSLVVRVVNGKHETIWPPEAAPAQYIYLQPKWKDKKAKEAAL